MDITKTIKQINRNKLTNNTQKAALKLLQANGQWLSRAQFRSIASAAARIRDLRKPQFGKFRVECKSAAELQRSNAKQGTFYYRINPNTVTKRQVASVFNLD